MFYPRLILPQLEKELKTFEIIVITGMRQVGKTTLLDHLFSLVKSSNKVKLDLENPLNRKVFEEENYDTIWNNLAVHGINRKSKAYVFLDEIQHLSSTGSVVKYLNDHFDVKFILTGSSSYYLKNLFPESMAGRKLIFEVFPLTFSEFLVFKGVTQKKLSFNKKAALKNNILHSKLAPFYKEYIEYGGFPKVVLQEDFDRKKTILSEIFTSYYESDVKSMADFRNITKLHDLILLLIPRVGSRIEIAKLAASLGVSRETVYSYLSFLEKTYFISLISKFSKSIDRQSAGTRKLFFCDTGIVNGLGKVSEGQLFEQSVFQNLRTDYTLNFYNKDGGNEIDFIINEKIALEVKTSASRRDIDHLKKRSKSLNLPEAYIVSKEYSREKEVILATDL